MDKSDWNEYQREWRKSHPDSVRESQRKHQQSKMAVDPDYFNKKRRERRLRNSEKTKEQNKIAAAKWSSRLRNDPVFAKKQRERGKAYASRPEVMSRTNARQRKDRYLKLYGITTEQYEVMLQSQSGECAICGSTDPGRGKKYFNVDHCHVSGKVRKLLCNGCNRAIGYFGDDATLLRKAADYIECHGQDSCPGQSKK